ncbi:hypothetical protein M569_07370, partial [Genlisea aurea]
KRLYQVWHGRNKFLCGGRLIFGPDASSLVLSTFLIGGPAVTFAAKMAVRIAHMDAAAPIFVVGLILTLLNLLFLFMTASTNPGIVPRNRKARESDTSSSLASTDWINATAPNLSAPKTRDVYVNGHTIKVKYCDTCSLYRPPRASHCSICNNCVQRFDHHCPWVNQCIGVRNYRSFILFVSTSTILCIYVFTFSLLCLLKQPGRMWYAMSRDIVSVILIVYCFISVWFVGGLTVFHFYLMCTNQTTYENFRFRYDKKENPYNKGVINNVREILLSKTAASLVDFRRWVAAGEEEDGTQVSDSVSNKFAGDIFRSNKEIGNVETG